MQRPVFFARGIIITSYLPIFTLQAVEGRLFKPMAWTVTLRAAGRARLRHVVAPVMASILFRKGAKEWQNPIMQWLTRHYRTAVRAAIEHRNITLGIATALFAIAVYLTVGGPIGSEFLPHLDEGSIWVRGTLPPSEGPTASIDFTNKARIVMASFPEVTQVVSQTGRPDDGTDTAGFFNTEYFVDLKRKKEWRPVFHQDKEALIAAMDKQLSKFPGVIWNYSQPISDNMEEAVSGVKGELAVKLYGDNLRTLEQKADEIQAQMAGVKGIQDLGIFRIVGQPNLNLARRSRRGGPLGHQRRRHPGRGADRGRRQRADPGAAGRSALRRHAALPEAVPRYARGDRERPPACAVGRARLAGAADHGLHRRRRGADQPRRRPALYRHQVLGARARPGLNGGRGHRQSQRTTSSCPPAITWNGPASMKARSAPTSAWRSWFPSPCW